MQHATSFHAGAFSWTPQPVRSTIRPWWVAPLLVALGVVFGFSLAPGQRAPTAAVPGATVVQVPIHYVSSDPSVPPADGVKFADPEPQPEAF